jgi:hypothetical protein
MTWEQIIAAAVEARFVRFQADGIAILEKPASSQKGEAVAA